MTLSRFFATLALAVTMSLCGAGAGIAQSLSDASLVMSSDWSSGYMGLGGNLGRAIDHRRHHAKPVKSAKASRTTHHRHAEKRDAHVERTSYKPKRRESPSFLIAESLDHSGLTINTLRLQQFP